ncbi:hypothetical protein V8B97DRAFT_2025227 [Scleroderma yunnanense]
MESTGAYQPVFCTSCCWAEHKLKPFHRVQQWNGTFFEESSLRLAGIVIHLGHAGQPCPTGGDFTQEVTTDDEDEWKDVEEDRRPTHLRSSKDRSCLVVVHTNGIHYCNVKYCTCLTMAGLFPATTKQPRTAFTFHVLDDFIRDNVECGTSAMNYYSKLQRITSNGFPHLVPVSTFYLVTSVLSDRMWRLLKLLKWQGLHTSPKDAGPGELVLFCLACLQPGFNIPKEGIDLSQWTFARTLVMDGNLKAEHMHPTDPNNEVWLMDGKGFMVESMPYKEYLKGSTKCDGDCSNHHAVNHANADRNQLASTSIGGCACARHGCFVSHAMVNMDYALVHAMQHGLEPGQKVIHFYDISCQYSKNLACQLKVNQFISMPAGLIIQPSIGLWHVHGHQTECFVWYAPNFIPGVGHVDGMATPHWQELLDFQMNDNNFLKMVWIDQADRAFAEQASKPEAMDIFEVQLEKAPTAKSIEMNLIYSQGPSQHQGSATWIARALKIEQAQHDQLQSQINSLIEFAAKVIGDDWDDLFHQAPSTLSGGGDANGDVFMLTQLGDAKGIILPLPSNIGKDHFNQLGLSFMINQELELRQGQANDCLHELWLALADKAIATVEAAIQWHVAMYGQFHDQMMVLGARPDILDQYKELNRSDLKVSTAVTDPNARGHRDNTLAWFWTMDMPQDTAASDWMSEFYHVNWLRTKALCDCERQWTRNYFDHRVQLWTNQHSQAILEGNASLACYSAKQCQMYGKLGKPL